MTNDVRERLARLIDPFSQGAPSSEAGEAADRIIAAFPVLRGVTPEMTARAWGAQVQETALQLIAFLAFAATIPAANWLIGNVGTTCVPNGPCLIPVGFSLMAPSGVLMIGLALVLRDWLHELNGWRYALYAVLLGGLLSLLVSPPAIALASAVAFTLAELADLTVYARLRARGAHVAVIASGIVGAALDSALFVWIAFGSLEFSAGTTLAKLYASAAVAAYLWARARRRVA